MHVPLEVSGPQRSGPIFRDPTGRRWRRVRWTVLAAGVLTTLLAAAVVVAILIPPVLPALHNRVDTGRSVWSRPRFLASGADRRRVAAKRRLFAALRTRRPIPRRRPSDEPGRRGALGAPSAPPIVAGFYVNWDDNSFASLRAHVGELDWVVCEWAFVTPTGGVRLAIDAKVLALMRQVAPPRPQLFVMVTNIDSATGRFDPVRLRALIGTPARRDTVVRQLAQAVRAFHLRGVTIDFEEVPDDLVPNVVAFARALRVALAPVGGLVTQAVGVDVTPAVAREYAAADDYVFLMLYDEHYGRGDPGPVASQRWYAAKAAALLRTVPPQRAILAVGAYGYDWNDAGTGASGAAMTFQEVMRAAREHGGAMRFDTASMNPYVTWTDPDSTDHVVWYLDGVTAFNQVRAGRAEHAAGYAVWRLGAEDPSLWGGVGRRARVADTPRLGDIPPGYDVEFDGTGELLNLAARPTMGRRDVRLDATGLVADERVTAYPTPYVVRRAGGGDPHRVALTFDDGPDPLWTGPILDTLRRYHAPAAFFVIGVNVERHIPLTRRIVAAGHEIGNHTFTHPNLALTSAFVARLEIDATTRALEAVVGRRTVFFRPPYFGDAEPTTADELVPVGIANDLGYVTVGVHVDAEDWRLTDPAAIVATVMRQRGRGNVILLHDGGGNRAATVAALGPIIDSLRAHGDTIVSLGALIGATANDVMPPLPAGGSVARAMELSTFALFGAAEWSLHWLFLMAMILGLGRVAVLVPLALWHRARRRRVQVPAAASGPGTNVYAPSVSVIVPAYNEERVIVGTVRSLVAQRYAGPLEIIVVDDGSSDDTERRSREAFEDDPQVRVFHKTNGGKASALNFGAVHATGEVLVMLDADTVFVRDTVARLVAPLADPAVAAVAGNAKVGNRINLVTRWQALEYVTSQNLDRRAFALLNGITVVPGAIGAWRTSAVRAAGGFTDDTLAEDQDLTIAVRRRGGRVAYADDAVAYTEAPDTLRGLAKQRFRWSFGTLQCMWKHRDALLRPRYGTLGLIAMPNVWLFQLLFAAVSPFADLLFVWALISVWLTGLEHGATYAATDLQQVMTFYAVFLLVDWAASMVAFLAEPDEDWRLTWLVVLQRFAYRQVMYWVVVRSFLVALRGHIVGWGKLERKATVGLPEAA